MSGFWDKQLGVPKSAPTQQAQPIVSQPFQNRPWWQSSQVPSPTPAAVQQQSVEPVQAPRQAISARVTDQCPSCGSINFGGSGGGSNVKRCFECGYNDIHGTDFSGMGGGIGSTAGAGPTQAALQHSSTSGGFAMPTTAANLEHV